MPSWIQKISFLLPARNPVVNGVFLLLAAVHLFIPIYNHAVFRTFGFDYAVYNFAFFDFAHFRSSPCPLYMYPAPASFWQDHFSLLLPLISPLYWITAPLAGTYALIIIQWLFVYAGGFFTLRLIARRNPGELLPMLAAVCYFMLHGRFTAHRTDVNLAIIGSSLIPVLMYYFDRRSWRTMWMVGVAIFVIREDMSLWLSFIGITLAILYRRDKSAVRQALVFSGVSLLYFVACMNLFIPWFLEDEHKKFTLFEYNILGADPGAALRYIIHDPLQVLKLLFLNHSGDGYYDNVKRDFYIVYFISGGFLLFFRPALFVPLIPLLAKKMLNDNPVRWGLDSYYAIEFVSILPILFFFVVSSIPYRVIRAMAGSVVALLAICVTIYVMHYPPESLHFPGSEKYNLFAAEFYEPEEDIREIRKVLALIPPGSEVSASGALTPHLAFRERILYFPVKTDTSYVVVLRYTNAYPLQQPGYNYEIARLLANTREWERLYESRKLLLLKGNPVSE